ncbi:MAG: BON domain-containing protein [Planctomycetota bacterium]
MNIRNCTSWIALVAIASSSGCDSQSDSATGRSGSTASSTPKADNSAYNKADANGNSKTPMDQSQTSADVKITAEIRRAIMDDATMSINAQNCKIITDKSGVVTLRGVVSSTSEKEAIEAKARAAAGVTSVDNQLEVRTN